MLVTSEDVIPNTPELKPTNLDQLPRGTGARYLECRTRDPGVFGRPLTAVRWRRKLPRLAPYGTVFLDTEPGKPQVFAK